MQAKKYLIVVGGATASGKTSTAIALARHFNTLVLSADSRQFYREMSIGTAKPTREELDQVPHYFIDSHSITEDYSVGAYESEALNLLHQLFQEKEVLILAGGSGLYINALCQGLDEFPKVPGEVRQSFENLWEEQGLEVLQEALRRVDPAYAKTVDMQNPHRLIRALSVQRVSGRPYSAFRKKAGPSRFFTPIYLQMAWDRSVLYDRINRRVDLMVEAGLETEARSLRDYRGHSALATVGYQEWWGYFDGDTGRESVIELIKRNTRRYAKRQLTWMRRDGFWRHFSPNDPEAIIAYAEWRMTTAYTLNTLRRDGQEIIAYQDEDQVVAQILMEKTKKYTLARVQVATDQRALESLLSEFTWRAGNRSQFLILPENAELSARELGFQSANKLQKLPVPVRNYLKTGDTLLVRNGKK
ncbi:MAG TPA: tRNA (adenosine(37)-N6)-dimethylallyltransferase MiaA [Saprospiraceae bacterium]|nr:tRNA (adenosine(37)-N6)-dimethylallyltransferase MiaA [Saprospiraceae bacterium]